MRMQLRIVLIAVFLGSCAAPQPVTQRQGTARELVGRTAGAPKRCVQIEQSQALRISDEDRRMLLYGSGKTIWANNLYRQCGFGFDDILITEPVGSYYCRGDLVRSIDRLSHIPGPACVLGDFVPYVR